MADPAPSHGNGRERLEFKVGGQSVGIATQNLIPVLILLLAMVAGYLVYVGQDSRFEQMHQQHLFLHRSLVHQNELMIEQTETIRKWLLTMDYNLVHPEQRLPLDIAPRPPLVPEGPKPAGTAPAQP
jgi:hypothetical protein